MRFVDLSHIKILDRVQIKIDLSKLCSCQIVELGTVLEEISVDKELLLVSIYIESLLQGIVYTYDRSNYWGYLEIIGNRKVSMIYHGTYEVQFRTMLQIPEYSPSFLKCKIESNLETLTKQLLPQWIRAYEKTFEIDAVRRLNRGVTFDPDIARLKDLYPSFARNLELFFMKEKSL